MEVLQFTEITCTEIIMLQYQLMKMISWTGSSSFPLDFQYKSVEFNLCNLKTELKCY